MKEHWYSKENIRVYLETSDNRKGFITDVFILILIALTSLLYVLETYSFPQLILDIFRVLDWIIIIIFTIEFFLRLWVAEDINAHLKSVYTWIDVIAIFPFWFGYGSLQFFRVFRFFRFLRYSRIYLDMNTSKFGRRGIEKLFVIRLLFTIFTIIFVSSALIFNFEKTANEGIQTFGDAAYFTLVTLTTVGFGDIAPVTQMGRFATMLAIISGIVFIPWHVGALIRFLVYAKNKKSHTCKRCGLRYHDPDAVFCKACGKRIYQEYDGESLTT